MRERRRLCRRPARATQLGVSPEDAERQDFAPNRPRGNAFCRIIVDASEIAFVAVFLASDKVWAVSDELVAARGAGTPCGAAPLTPPGTGHVPQCHRQRRDNASGGSYIDGFNIPCAAVASF